MVINLEAKPKVSVVVPLYNRQKLIVETIESVRRQSYSNFELLVIDDHSNDESFLVAKNLARSDDRIRTWQRKSAIKGAPACRNEGISAATGDRVVFVDSDDLLAKDCLQNRVASFALLQDRDFHIFPSKQFRNVPGDLELDWFRTAEDHLAGFLERPLWNVMSAIWNTESIRRLGGFREDLLSWQDWDLHVRALVQGFKYQVHENASADNYVRRSLHDRISFSSERDVGKLENRKQLFRDTHRAICQYDKMTEVVRENMKDLFIGLATKLRIVGSHQSADQWIVELAEMELIPKDMVESTIRYSKQRSRMTLRQRVSEFKLWLVSTYRRLTG